jgi:hypothetical protein
MERAHSDQISDAYSQVALGRRTVLVELLQGHQLTSMCARTGKASHCHIPLSNLILYRPMDIKGGCLYRATYCLKLSYPRTSFAPRCSIAWGQLDYNKASMDECAFFLNPCRPDFVDFRKVLGDEVTS